MVLNYLLYGTEYSTELSQCCKVYAESEIRSGEMDKKNARLARSRAFSFAELGPNGAPG